MSENERSKTTTISTIAIQSGNTRIVIALLKSADVLELKILELVPDLTLLGETFEEASELEIAHNHVMKQLQNKQSPVEELLKKADQVIADQKPKAEVYAAMADSLGQAWKDIHSHLALRKHILHMNVTYHSQAEACMERMRALELLCLSPIPTKEEMVKESLECMQEIKKSMLECLMASLKAGQTLLSALNEIANENSMDSRPGRVRKSALSAIAQVEQWMEQLHNRRRLLDVTWQRRKLNLEKYRTLTILKCDLELLETLLRERYELLAGSRYEFGDSSSSAELLLEEHLKLVPEATKFQEEGLRMVKASEQLPSSAHTFSEQSNRVSYNVLDLSNEYMQAVNDRGDLLRKCISFFKCAKSAMMKLEEMEYQLKNVNSISERLIIMNMTEDITKDVINDGHRILERAPEAKGVRRALDEIENAKLNLMSYCIRQNEENYEISQIMNNFYEKHNQLFSWLVTAVESFIQGHQDMGGGLSMAQNYLQLHEQLLDDLRIRSSDVIEITESVSPHVLTRLPSNTKEDILQKLETITSHWEYLKNTLEERIRLSSKYSRFHSVAVSLANELDSFDKSLTKDVTEVDMLPKEYSDSIDRLYMQLSDIAGEFVAELRETQDSYLDVKRAQLCVETVLEHFANRKSVVEDKRTIWERSAFDKKTSQALWSKNMVDSENTIDWVGKLESQLYPVLNVESVSTDVQIHQVNDKLNNIIPEIKRAQQEIQLRIRTAKELIAKGTLETNEEVPPKLNELYNDICTVIVEYTVFLEMFTAFLNNVKELEKKINDLKSSNDRVTEVSSKQVNELKVKHVAASKAFHDLWDITFSESQRIIDKIEHQEPTKYAEKDIRCIKNLLESKKSEWQELSDGFEQKLKKWQTLKQFDEDLESIHVSIRELSEELSALQHQYSLSLSAAKSSSVAFQYFEKTIQTLEGKIDSFINTAEEVLEISESKSKDIESQLNQLKDRWNKFCAQVTETRRFIDLSIQYFTLIDETEECFREGTKLLVCVARKSSTARTPDEAEELLSKIQTFQSSAQIRQEERINSISKLVAELFDDGEHARQVNRIVLENNDMLDSFLTVSKELAILQQKLKAVETDKPVKDVVATEIVSLEKLPSSLEVENVEVIHLIEEEKSISEKSEITETSESSIQESKVTQETKSARELPKCEKPVFISPLKDGKVQEGSRFVFECQVTGYPKPVVTWFKDGFAIENNPDYQTTYDDGLCRLRIEETFAEDSAKFACRASNDAGSDESSAKLTVIENVADDLQPPCFIIPLFDEIVRAGDAYEFHCKVGGNPLPDVQWYKNDTSVDSLPEFESTFNNGDARLVIKSVASEDNGRFSCTATNSLGSVSSSANLTVKTKSVASEAPQFATKLTNVMARAGQKLKLECKVTGKPFPTLLWTLNGKPLKEASNTNMSIDDAGNVVLAISEAFPKDAGVYTLTATNSAGESSCSSNVSVKGLLPCETSDSEIPSDAEPVRPSIRMPLKDVSVTEGSEALLECVIVGLPEPEVIWYHNNVPIKESKDIELLFKGDKCSLLIREVCPEDEGEYKVIAINSAGETSSVARLCVQTSSSQNETIDSDVEGVHPKFTKLLSDILVREGDTAVLDCTVEGYPKPTIKWFLNKNEINYSDRIEHEENTEGVAKLTIKNVIPEDKGLYTVRASNSLGEAKCFSHMIIKSLSSRDSKPSNEHYLKDKLEYPSFVETFADKSTAEGGFVKFECIASGKPAPKVKWLFNNEPVSGKSFLVSTSGDRQVLSIPEASAQNDGLVTCVAENDAGKATCTAQLRVLPKVHDNLIPTLDATMNMYESTQSFEMKKAVFSKSSATNDAAPVTKLDSYLTVHEATSQKLNDNEPVKMESRHVEERHETDGKSEQSSQSFSFGNLDVQNKIKASKECTVASLKPARKQTAPRFICTIDGNIVDEGADVKFEAVVESYPPANITWYRNNEQLYDIPNKITITWELNKATLKLRNVHALDAGRYLCSASNDAGSASSAADLFVKKNIFPPVMGKRLHPQSAAVGTRVMFEVEVTGTPTPLVTWFKDDKQLAKVSPFYRLREQGNSHALIIEKARLDDIGQYKARAHNEAGEAVSIATLNVFEPPPTNNTGSQYSIEKQSFDSEILPANNFESRNYSSQFSSSQKSEFRSVKSDKKIKFNVDENDKPIETKKEGEFSALKEYDFKPFDYGGETKSQSYESFHKEESVSKNTNGFKETNLYSMDYSKSNNEPAIQREAFSSYSACEPLSPYTNSFILEPGPPPEMGYIPKEAVPKAREAMAERVKKLESSQRQLSPVEIPPGAVKIFPTIIPKKKDTTEGSALEKKYSSCIKEYKKTIGRSLSNETPNILISETSNESAPIYRPGADVDLRPASPRPSAEGVSMERLWSHKKTEEIRPATPKSDFEKFKVPDIKRSLSPVPSAEGVAMDKLWSHPVSGDKRRPHSVIGLSDVVAAEKTTESSWSSGGYDVKESYKKEIVEEKSNQSTCSLQRAVSEERQKKKFKWPPEEVSFENSLVRKTSDKFNLEPGPPPEMSFAEAPANFEQSSYVKTKEQDLEKNIETTAQKYVYGGVRVVPAPAPVKTSSSYQKQESSNYQTLPRSFKFASSGDSKFKPVKPYVKSFKQKSDSDYEYDTEVTKINVYPQPTSKESVSEFSSQKEFNSFTDQKVTNLRESGYAADTDEPNFRGKLLQKNTYSKPIFNSSSYQKYDELSKTQTLPRMSENKVTRTLNESTTKSFAPSYGAINPPKFSKSDYRESDYESDFDSRIPPIWRPSDSEPEEPHYRPVRPNLTPVKRTISSQNEYSDNVSKFQPVSPVTYAKPNDNVLSNKYKNFGYSGDSSAVEVVKSNDFKPYQRANSYEGYQSVSESVDKSFSKYSSEVKRIQKVEEIKKRFESRSTSYTDDVSYANHGDSNEVYVQSRIPNENFASSKQSETFKSYKTNSQQFIDDIVNKVNSRQNELKQGALKSPSLYSPSVYSREEPQVFRDHYRNTEHVSSNEGNWVSDMQRSTESEYIIINGSSQSDKPQKAPFFITPLHDIAAVIGSLARFECIVQSDPPVAIVWKKDGEVLHDTDLLQINFRNGVCKLTLSKTYKYDAGTYQCIAKNNGGIAETSATLSVSGERRSYIKK